MTLNVNEPTDQRTVSELPGYIREGRAEINSLLAGSADITVNNLSVAAAQTSLTVGTDLTDVAIEVVILTGLGVATLATILGGLNGHIKIFVFQNAVVSLLDGAKNNGKFYLNHLPALAAFNAQQDDVIALCNIGGDGASNHGYWVELYRKIAVK